MPTISNEPWSLCELEGVLEVYEGIFGRELGRARFRVWLEGRQLTEEAFDFIQRLYQEEKP